MLTKKQLHILSSFHNNLFAELTFKHLKEQSRQTSNNVVQLALKVFKKENIVKPKTTGDVTTYALNLDNNRTIAYLNIINQELLTKRKIPRELMEEMQSKVLKQTEFFILIIFGSYAKNKATEKSDVDVAVIVESEQTKKEITPSLETVKRRALATIDYHVFTRSEFIEMLRADYENVGKQICKNNLVYFGFMEYCNLLRGMRYG